MRVLTLSYEFPPLGGGGSKVVRGLSAEFVRMRHEVDVVSMRYGDLPRFEEIQGICVHRVPCMRRSVDICQPYEQASYMVGAFREALRLAGRQPFDIMHCHFIVPDGVVALLARRRLKIPLVVTAHGSDVPGYNPDRFKLLHQLIFPAWRSAVRSIDRIVCPSRYLEGLLLEHEPRARTTIIPNGFNVAKFSATRERRKSILVVSRMLERKGVQEVLRALAGIDMGFEVNVVGTGPYLKKLVELARTLGLDIKFRGWLDNDSNQLKELFETSAIFVLPSHAENFPLVLLEAMAAGTAIVTTDQTGCREVVGDAALLVPPRDERAIRNALQQLAADDALRDRLGREARNRLDRLFSWPAVARRYIDLFESLRSLDRQRVDAAETKSLEALPDIEPDRRLG